MLHQPLGRAQSQRRDFWLEHFQQWQQSGLRKSEYCRQHNLSAGNFYNWCHIFSKTPTTKTGSTKNNPPLQLIPVTLKPEPVRNAATVTVSCAALSVTIPADLQAEQINTWLGTLAGLHV